jgi:pimeloyl-ACP methyl ester carboxylesterase
MITLLLVLVAFLAMSLGGLVIFTAITARRVEKALPPRGEFIEVAGARIHYLDKGSGPPIVILHGLGGQMGNFTYALLERLTSEFRVILMDRPGSGYSRRAPGATGRLTEQATIVAEFIRKLGLDRPLLVGH